MKKLVLLNGIDETVIIPIYQSVTKDIVKNLNLIDVPIVNDDNLLLEKNADGKATIDKNLHNTYLQVSYTMEPLPEVEAHRTPVHPDGNFFYKDDDSKVSARASYRSARMNFEIIVKSKSKSTISRVIDLLYHRRIDIDTFDTHNVQISYTIPNIVKQLILEVYNIKKEHENITMSEYLNKTLNKEQLDMGLSLTGDINKNSYIVTEYLVDALGEFVGDFDKMTKDKNDLYYALTLNYQLDIQRPLGIHIEYPYLIYNQTLSDIFKNKYYNHDNRKIRNHEDAMFKLLKKYDSFGINKTGYYLTYPRYDEFNIKHKLNNYTTIITVLAIVDKDKPYELFNINDLPTLQFKDSVYNLLMSNRENIAKYLKTMFYFNIYVNDDEIIDNSLVLDSDGNLTTTFPMDIKNTYRIGIHLCDNLSNLNGSVREDTIRYVNREIVENQDKINKLSAFGIENQKSGIRTNHVEPGMEVYEDGLFLDVYLEMFNVTKDEVTNMINKGTTQSPGEVLFKIKIPNYYWPKLTNMHYVRIFKLFREKE